MRTTKELTDIKYIMESQVNTSNKGCKELKRELDRIIEEKSSKFKEILKGDTYDSYVTSVKEYITSSEHALSKRKDMFLAVMDGRLIGGFA